MATQSKSAFVKEAGCLQACLRLAVVVEGVGNKGN